MSDDRADATAWLAVAAGTIGALMATLDTSIVNASLPTIQGEIGASTSEGTWVSTAYLVAEIIMIPIAGWLEGIFGLRNFLLIATTSFTAFSIWCGVSDSLLYMIFGRIGQGFTGGAMIPTAMSIVSTRLPPRQQPVGIALFGMTAVLGPVLGPILGGWLTENLSWHDCFFLNVPIGIGLLGLLVTGLPGSRIAWGKFRDADLPGLIGLVLGLGGLTVVLEEGQRSLWFESATIRELTAVSAFGILLLLVGQAVSRVPVVRLRILLTRSFGGVFLLSLMMGAALYGLLYVIPQFLTAVPGYNSEQAGLITAVSGVPTILMLAIFPVLVRRIDMRIAVGLGLLLYGISCLMDSGLSPETSGGQFFWTQIMRGFGQFFSLLFLNQAATNSVALQFAEDASGLFNAARNLGGSFGLAAVSTLQERRVALHVGRISESITANSVLGQENLRQQGVGALGNLIQAQATVMAYADLYWIFGVVLLLLVPLVLMLKPLAAEKASKDMA